MTEKRFTVQRIYKGMDNGVKYYDWCVMKNDEIILRLTTRMDCKDVVEVLNKVAKENEELRTKNNAYLQDIEVYKEDNTHLKLENEQLKQFLQSLAEQSINGKVMLRDGKVYDLNEILKKGDVE